MSDAASNTSLASGFRRRSRSHSKERDQRIPTFQILLNNVEIETNSAAAAAALRRNSTRAENDYDDELVVGENLKNNPHHHHHHPTQDEDIIRKREGKGSNSNNRRATVRHYDDNDNEEENNTNSRSHQQSLPTIIQGTIIPHHHASHKVHPTESSVSSPGGRGYRGPACNFAQQELRVVSTSSVSSERTNKNNIRRVVASPGLSTSKLIHWPVEEHLDEVEPPDVVVWNATAINTNKNRIRSCSPPPLNDLAINNNGGNSRRGNTNNNGGNGRRERSTSLPSSTRKQNSILKTATSQLLNSNIDYKGELHDNDFPDYDDLRSVSVSTVSSVAHQLEEIQQVQNDLLKQLGDEISRVNSVNEDLKKKVDGFRNQNDGLLRVIKEANMEIEKMKHIFLSTGLQLPQQQQPAQNTEYSEKYDEPRPGHGQDNLLETSLSYQHQPSLLQRRERRPRSRSRSRESSSSARRGNKGSGEVNAQQNQSGPNGSGESPLDGRDMINFTHATNNAAVFNKNNKKSSNNNEGSSSSKSRIPKPIRSVEENLADPYNDKVAYKSSDHSNSQIDGEKDHHRKNSSKKKQRSRSREMKDNKLLYNNNNNEDSVPRKPDSGKNSKEKVKNKDKEGVQRKKAAGGGGGCCVRMFGCCVAKPANNVRKDSSDDDIPFHRDDKINHNDNSRD